ncbi:MAG: hypothetical protein QM498_10260 [Desulfobacterium sp.]
MYNVHPSQTVPQAHSTPQAQPAPQVHSTPQAQSVPQAQQPTPQTQLYNNAQPPTSLNHDQYLYQYKTTDPAYAYNTAQPETAPIAPPNGIADWYNFSNGSYLKGFFMGAGITLLVTNPTVQKGIVTGAVKLWSMVQGGVEEVKEQIQDVKAEMSQK